MIFSNKLLTLGFLSAALTISSISVQAMELEAKKLSVAQFNALSFEDMKERIEERLNDIILYKPHGQDYANMIRELLDGVSNGATSKDQFAIIMNSALVHGNSCTGLFKAFYWHEYLITQFFLYRAGISGEDLENLLWLTDDIGLTVFCYASCAGPEYLDLILNHPMFNGSEENEAKLVTYILTPNQENGMTILHYAAFLHRDLIVVVKKLIGKVLGKIDSTTLHAFINALVKEKIEFYPWNRMTAAGIAREEDEENPELAEFLDSFTQEKIDCTVKACKGIKRCAELRKKLEEEKIKLRSTNGRKANFVKQLSKMRNGIYNYGYSNE